MLQALIEALEQRSPARQHHSLVHDVGGQFRRSAVQRRLDGVDDRVHRLLDGTPDFLRRDHDRLREPGHQVPTAELRVGLVGEGKGRADRHLDLLGGALPQRQRVLLLDVGDDRLVELVPPDADRQGGHDAAEGDDGDLGGAAADVDDHVARRLVDGQTGADGRRHRLLDDVGGPGACRDGGLLHGPLLHPGDAGGDADHDPGLGEHPPLVHLLDEVAEHLLGDVEVGDHAVLEGPDGEDVAGGPADHPLGLRPDRQDGPGLGVDRHDRRLVEHGPAPPDVDEGVGRAEVDGHVPPHELKRSIEWHGFVLLYSRSPRTRFPRRHPFAPPRHGWLHNPVPSNQLFAP